MIPGAGWAADPGHAAILLDFDGTLAPIVADPADARPLPGATDVLGVLAGRYRLVAVVSGRPAEYLAIHLDVAGVDRWGAYGLQHIVDGRVVVAPSASAWQSKVASVVARGRAVAPAGVGVEDKGITVTLHFRGAPESEGWVRAFAAESAAATGLAVHDAKMSAELRPPVPIDKGTVVAGLVADAGVQAACFVGDDVGDLSAFRALDAVDSPLRVAVRSDEAPAELLAAADLVVDGPAGVLEFLRSLAG